MADLFNLSFMAGIFYHLISKLQKQFLSLKKIKNQIIATVIQSTCYQILKKFLKNLCIRDYTFLDNNNIIYNFGFRQQYSTSHVIIDITENIRKTLDDRNISCGIFVDWQKAFNTVDHQILPAKLDHYGVCGVSINCFKPYLTLVSIYP